MWGNLYDSLLATPLLGLIKTGLWRTDDEFGFRSVSRLFMYGLMLYYLSLAGILVGQQIEESRCWCKMNIGTIFVIAFISVIQLTDAKCKTDKDVRNKTVKKVKLQLQLKLQLCQAHNQSLKLWVYMGFIIVHQCTINMGDYNLVKPSFSTLFHQCYSIICIT